MEELSSSYLWHRLFWPGAGACSPRSCPAGGGQDCVSPCRHRPLPPSPSELNKKEHIVGHAAQAVGNVYAVHAALEGTGSRQCCTRGNCVSYAVLHKNKREPCVVGSAAQEGTVCVVRSAAQEGTVCNRDVKAQSFTAIKSFHYSIFSLKPCKREAFELLCPFVIIFVRIIALKLVKKYKF